jgi:hypothetical protein
MPPKASPKLKCRVMASIAFVNFIPLIQMTTVETKNTIINSSVEMVCIFIE